MAENTQPRATEYNIFSEINDLAVQKDRLIEMRKKGIIEGVDVVIQELTKKELKLKETKVLSVHKNAITKVTVKKQGKTITKWQTRCEKARPRCSSYEALIDKLYKFYFDKTAITNFSFKTVFEAALDEKIRTERPKEKTVRDYHISYRAFITDEFGARDIRLISPSEIKEYIQTTSIRLAPTKKRFYKFKGVLNLAFEYACDPERRYLEFNPVPLKNKAYAKNFTPSSRKPEDKAFQPDEVERIRSYLWERVHQEEYDVNGYAILFSSETGLREGEIPSLKWSDVSGNAIHIHSQQNDEYRDGVRVFYYNPSTKNEKGISSNGRYIPITNRIREILSELKDKQEKLGIRSEWVFCKEDGTWMTTVSYYKALYRVAKKLGLALSNNHAFRMALNSYVYVPMGLPATERAKLLGHSVETNLKYYTFARTDDYIDELCEKMNAYNAENSGFTPFGERGTSGYLKIVDFKSKKESPDFSKIKAFS
ncbi:MAG: tyrosine-type recombinase/integrase [Lachnospiraceae bacterium]|nr:tyrosine-type recombinase/integrase [Lachnospiraceae bacterium]